MIHPPPLLSLSQEEFYKFAVTQLAPGGVLVTQSGPGALHTCDECFTTIHKTLRTAFSRVVPYTVSIPSFGCDWGFNMAYGLSGEEAIDEIEVAERKSSATNALIKQKIKGELRFMDGAAHLGIFGIPKWLRTAIEQEDRIMTVDNPVYMH
jgi:thermospermine synthase